MDGQRSDDFLWVLRWLRQEQHCDPALNADLIRTPSMKRKMKAVNRGVGVPRVRWLWSPNVAITL